MLTLRGEPMNTGTDSNIQCLVPPGTGVVLLMPLEVWGSSGFTGPEEMLEEVASLKDKSIFLATKASDQQML